MNNDEAVEEVVAYVERAVEAEANAERLETMLAEHLHLLVVVERFLRNSLTPDSVKRVRDAVRTVNEYIAKDVAKREHDDRAR